MTDALFQQGSFILSSGQLSVWKIECDELTSEDWDTLALIVHEQGLSFRMVVGVPGGGVLFARALRRYAGTDGPILVVDDVLTTGGSIIRFMKWYDDPVGLVVFARGKLPERVRAIWSFFRED